MKRKRTRRLGRSKRFSKWKTEERRVDKLAINNCNSIEKSYSTLLVAEVWKEPEIVGYDYKWFDHMDQPMYQETVATDNTVWARWVDMRDAPRHTINIRTGRAGLEWWEKMIKGYSKPEKKIIWI